MKILLTGATGFIGGKTASLLKQKNHIITPFTGDVRNVNDWKQNLSISCETIMHLGSVRTESEKDFAVNTRGTENLFKAISDLKKIPRKVIIASSQAVYIGLKPPFSEEMTVYPETIYGQSKYEAEKVGLKNSGSINIVILRYSTVIGPGIREKSNMSGPVYRWVESALKGDDLIVFQDGKQTRDYVHIDDVVNANLLAVTNNLAGIYNVGGGKVVSLKELAALVKNATNSDSRIVVNGIYSKNDPHDLYSDISKLKSLGWKPRKTVREGVFDFVRSFRKLNQYPKKFFTPFII